MQNSRWIGAHYGSALQRCTACSNRELVFELKHVGLRSDGIIRSWCLLQSYNDILPRALDPTHFLREL